MPLVLPSSPEPRAPFTPRLIRSFSEQRGLMGNNQQRIYRKAAHYAADFEMPPMTPEEIEAGGWSGLKTADTVIMTLPQPGLDTGAPGSPRVNGGGQAGSNLILDGLTPSYAMPSGRALTVISGGRRFVYMTDQDAVANASAQMTVHLETMLRYPPSDNDAVLIAEPQIEGFATFDEDAFRIREDGYVWLSFTIEERG